GKLPQAEQDWQLRQLRSVLRLWNHRSRHRLAGPHGGLPVDQARGWQVWRAQMNRYRQSKLIRLGFLGVVVLILVIAVGLQPDRLLQMATALRYHARFSEAGGITVDDDVTVSGIKVGSVTAVNLQRGEVALDFTVDSTVQLGSDTTAHIRTSSVLGRRVVTL